MATGIGTKTDPWQLKTPPLSSEYQTYYDAKDGTVEAWARGDSNPVSGWYGLKKGLRGRFGMYMPPLLEALGLAEVEHNARGNRMRAK